MRAVVQRVLRASVAVDGQVVADVGAGLAVLVGIGHTDTEADARALAAKLAGLRIFADNEGKMNRSIVDVDGAVLLVSQFTLYADVRKGRRPSFTDAAPPDVAVPLLDVIAAELAASGVVVRTGRFGAHMHVDLVNDGPVTLVVEVADGKVR